MKKNKRLAKGERNFKKYIIPAIKEEFPGIWQSTNGTMVDIKYGIDFYYTNKQEALSISARVWECEPKQHFAVRWKKESNPNQELEVASRLKALKNDLPMSNYTIEGFIWKSWIYIAWIDSKILWDCVSINLEDLNQFPVKNIEGGATLFKQVPFSLFNDEQLKKKTVAITSL